MRRGFKVKTRAVNQYPTPREDLMARNPYEGKKMSLEKLEEMLEEERKDYDGFIERREKKSEDAPLPVSMHRSEIKLNRLKRAIAKKKGMVVKKEDEFVFCEKCRTFIPIVIVTRYWQKKNHGSDRAFTQERVQTCTFHRGFKGQTADELYGGGYCGF